MRFNNISVLKNIFWHIETILGAPTHLDTSLSLTNVQYDKIRKNDRGKISYVNFNAISLAKNIPQIATLQEKKFFFYFFQLSIS